MADLAADVAKRLRYKKESEDFQRQYAPDAEVLQEPGVREDSFVPGMEEELSAKGWKMGAAPSEAPGGAAAEADAVGPILQRLFGAGFDESKAAEAAQNVRTAGSHTFVGPKGVTYTVGESSPLGQELKAYGRAKTNDAWAARQAEGLRK